MHQAGEIGFARPGLAVDEHGDVVARPQGDAIDQRHQGRRQGEKTPGEGVFERVGLGEAEQPAAIELFHQDRQPTGFFRPAQAARHMAIEAAQARVWAEGVDEHDEGGPFLQDELLHQLAGMDLLGGVGGRQEQQAVRIAIELFGNLGV